MIVLTIRPEQEGYCMLIARNGRRARWADLNADEQKMVRFGYRGEIFLYTMIGGKNDFAECFERTNYWRKRLLEARRTNKRCQVFAYAQPYRNPNKANHTIPMWQKDMASWVNKRMIFLSTEFKDFEPRKNFKCKEYFR